MPTYELHCKECGHRFERFLMRLLKDADRVCPACGSTQVAPGVGGGFVASLSTTQTSCAPSGGFS
jgi:putative FmdB family regulatory protein